MLYNKYIPSHTMEQTQTFTKDNLNICLKELAKAYKKLSGRHAEAEIVLIGGAAILAGYDFREMTIDIDAIIRADSSMKTAINQVGDAMNLPNGWLNTDFMKTSSYSPKLPQYSRFYKSFGGTLNVRIISGEYLIAMKLCSFRPYKKDQSDILGVLLYHKNTGTPITIDQVKQAVLNLYGTYDLVSSEAKNFIENAIKNENLENLFFDIIKQEQASKQLLIDFEKEYQNVLTSDNLDEILHVLKGASSAINTTITK